MKYKRNKKGQFASFDPSRIVLIGIFSLSIISYAYGQLHKPQEMLSPCPDSGCEAHVSIVGEIHAQEPENEPEPTISLPEPVTNTQKRVVSKIREIWGDDADFGQKLAFCESSYGINLTNGSSTASGIFQFLAGTWTDQRQYMGEDTNLLLRFDEDQNIKTAYAHYQRMGVRPWEASRHCWSQ